MTSLILAAALTLQVPTAPWLNGGRAPESPENVVAGHDWMNDSGLRCAAYDENGNILMNPSFEGGQRYWMTDAPNPPIETFLSSNYVRTGKCSLFLKKHLQFRSACVVLATNAEYTISFYVHTGDSQKGETVVQVNGWAARGGGIPAKRVHLTPSNGWRRIVHTFRTTPVQRETQIVFAGSDCYLDDVQLERGSVATDYRGNLYAVNIVLDSHERTYCDARKDAKPRLRLSGPVGAAGKLVVSVTDVFQRNLFKAAKRFRLGKAGEVVLPLDDKAFPKGTLVATVRVEPDGGLAFQDYLRWTKIDYLGNTYRNKNLMLDLSLPGSGRNPLASEHVFARLMHFGIGGYNYGKKLNEWYGDWAEKYRLVGYDCGFTEGSHIHRTETLNGKPFRWDGVHYFNMTNYPPNYLRWIEDNAAEVVAKHPKVLHWTLETEPTGKFFPLKDFVIGDRNEYAKFILAFQRGLKRGNPKAILNPYGDWNMFAGARFNICDMLKRVKRLDPNASSYFPSIEVHSYRQRPIVEGDLSGFCTDLDRAGFPEMKIRIGEGSYFYPMWRQSYDIQRGCGPKDDYSNWVVIPSYDIGWGERFSAMCVTRETLGYYRHADRVESNCSWNPKWIAGENPIAWIAANNALANLLGNATFIKEVRFATDAQAYVFDDAAGRTVAAVWREHWDFDRGIAPTTTMEVGIGDLGLGVGGLEVFDLMGNLCAIEQSNNRTITLPLSGFVVYLRVPNGKRKTLISGLEASVAASDKGKSALFVDYRVKDAETDEVMVENPLSHSIRAKIKFEGLEKSVSVPTGGAVSLVAKLPKRAVATEGQDFVRAVEVTDEGGVVSAFAFTNRVSIIPYAASPIDWEKVPCMTTGRGDRTYAAEWKPLKVVVQRAWNEREIAFRLDVSDSCAAKYADPSKYCCSHPGNRHGFFNGIRAYFFFDPFYDGASRQRRALGTLYGWDDFVYSAIPVSDTEAICWRNVAPDAQLAGGAQAALLPACVEPNVKTKFRVRPGGYVYEIIFPAWYVQPLILKAGTVFALAYDIYGAADENGISGCRWHGSMSWMPNGDNPQRWNPCILVK